VEYQRQRLEKLRADVRLRTTLSNEILKEIEPRLLVLAIGAEPCVPKEIKIGVTRPLYVEDLIRSGFSWSNVHIAVVGGGALGCEFALAIAEANNKITILEALGSAARDIEPISRFDLLDRIAKEPRVRLLTNTRVMGVDSAIVHYETELKESETLNVDHVVWATGYCPRQLNGFTPDTFKGLEVRRIGDCLIPRNVFQAVRDGFWLGMKIEQDAEV
jgi:pyruvate/2-oxoglutarate dehydrogenase complex dihydrolipoamide dehydrogenase (E3) component